MHGIKITSVTNHAKKGGRRAVGVDYSNSGLYDSHHAAAALYRALSTVSVQLPRYAGCTTSLPCQQGLFSGPRIERLIVAALPPE